MAEKDLENFISAAKRKRWAKLVHWGEDNSDRGGVKFEVHIGGIFTKALKGHGDFQKKAIRKSLYRIVQSVLTD